MYQIYFSIPRSRFVLPFSFTFFPLKKYIAVTETSQFVVANSDREREREREKKTEETKRQSGEEKYSFFSVISIRALACPRQGGRARKTS